MSKTVQKIKKLNKTSFFNKNEKRRKSSKKCLSDYGSFILGLTEGLYILSKCLCLMIKSYAAQ